MNTISQMLGLFSLEKRELQKALQHLPLLKRVLKKAREGLLARVCSDKVKIMALN